MGGWVKYQIHEGDEWKWERAHDENSKLILNSNEMMIVAEELWWAEGVC